MDNSTLIVIISFTIIGLLLVVNGFFKFKRNFVESILSCVAGSIFIIGINLMATV